MRTTSDDNDWRRAAAAHGAPSPSESQHFTLRVGLGGVPATADEVRTEIGDRLIEHQASLITRPDGQLEVRLTVVADDVWQAALTAIAATTATGYAPAWMQAWHANLAPHEAHS